QGCTAFSGASIHAGEPLTGGTVDNGGLVPPAMHIAVLDGFHFQKGAGQLERFDDEWVGLPDSLAAKQRKAVGILTVALHRIKDVLVLQPMGFAGNKVLHPVGGGRVNDTSARIQRDVITTVNGRNTAIAFVSIVKRM